MSWQEAMDAFARYGGCHLNAAGTYNEIITSGVPLADQVLDKRGFIAIMAVTETTLAAMNYNDNLWSGEDVSTMTIPAGQVIYIKFTTIRISAGQCVCIAAGQGTFTNGVA